MSVIQVAMLGSTTAAYAALLAVADEGTVTAAARRLGLPRPTLSRQLAQLESDLGVALLHRSTRGVHLTAAGVQLVARVGPLAAQWHAAEVEARDEAATVRGTVRVSVLPLLAPALVPVLVSLRHEHPGLEVEVVSNVHLPDLRSEGYDAGIWAGEPRDPELVVRTLGVGLVGLVASPDYLATHGTPTAVAALAEHVLLRGHDIAGRARHRWPLLDGGRVRVHGPFVSNDAQVLLEAARAGMGICLLSDLNARRALDSGELVRVLPGVVGRQATVRLILTRREGLPLRVRTFADAVGAGLGAALGQPSEGVRSRRVL